MANTQVAPSPVSSRVQGRGETRKAASLAVASGRGWGRGLLREVVLVLGLVALAALVRLPNVHVLPPYTDETEEALRAWAIAQGDLRPLVNVDSYIGALWSYVVAAGFLVFGRNAEIPRLASLAAGALTVGMTYLLGRRLFGRPAGLLAAFLMAANAVHILVSSHVAWSNCVTPLFTTTALWLTHRALERPGLLGRLALAGLTWGLAFQTHPSVAALLVGAALYALWRDSRLPLRPGAWLAVLLLAVGYGNVLVYNLGSGFDTLTQAQRVGSEYAGGSGLDTWGYLASLLGILVLIVHTTAGVVDPRMTAAEYLVDPRVLVALVALLASLAWSVKRRELLLLCIAVPVIVLVPALNQRWSPILASRYIMPLIPLVLVMIAGLVVALGARMGSPSPQPPLHRSGEGAGGRGFPVSFPLALAAIIAVIQLGSLWFYSQTEILAGRSNDGPWRMVRLAEEQRRAREPFVVHSDLHLLPTGGGGTWAKALDYLLELEDVRKDVSPRDPDARLRACDVTAVTLRYVERPEGRRRQRDEPSAERYWIARQAPLPGQRREELGQEVGAAPYSLPWRNRSLFDARAPTFDTGCE